MLCRAAAFVHTSKDLLHGCINMSSSSNSFDYAPGASPSITVFPQSYSLSTKQPASSSCSDAQTPLQSPQPSPYANINAACSFWDSDIPATQPTDERPITTFAFAKKHSLCLENLIASPCRPPEYDLEFVNSSSSNDRMPHAQVVESSNPGMEPNPACGSSSAQSKRADDPIVPTSACVLEGSSTNQQQ